VWSGLAGDVNDEQNLYLAKMSSPTSIATDTVCIPVGSVVTCRDYPGQRFFISQPREPWERIRGNPFINEAPVAIKDPNGQLHIFYSANFASTEYCIAELRLKAGGNPTNVGDYWKSNGCLFGSNPNTMIQNPGWAATQGVNGPGSHTFALENGDINNSLPAGNNRPMLYTAVPKGSQYQFQNRQWFVGGYWWIADCTFRHQDNSPDTGWSLKFYEDPNYNGGRGGCGGGAPSFAYNPPAGK